MFNYDLNEALTPSITIINCTDENDVLEHVKFAQQSLNSWKMEYPILNMLAKDFPEYVGDINTFKNELKGQVRSKFEIPNYIVCNGKIYDGKTYLKTHNTENGISIYDYLAINNMILVSGHTPFIPENQQPATYPATEKNRGGR